jgi:hypothetical protein
VAGLDDPATRAPSGCCSFQLEFVAAATDVSAIATSGHEVADPGIRVAAVEAQALRMFG